MFSGKNFIFSLWYYVMILAGYRQCLAVSISCALCAGQMSLGLKISPSRLRLSAVLGSFRFSFGKFQTNIPSISLPESSPPGLYNIQCRATCSSFGCQEMGSIHHHKHNRPHRPPNYCLREGKERMRTLFSRARRRLDRLEFYLFANLSIYVSCRV